jgi:hypothetical protein
MQTLELKVEAMRLSDVQFLVMTSILYNLQDTALLLCLEN